jgi:hypothetical protein
MGYHAKKVGRQISGRLASSTLKHINSTHLEVKVGITNSTLLHEPMQCVYSNQSWRSCTRQYFHTILQLKDFGKGKTWIFFPRSLPDFFSDFFDDSSTLWPPSTVCFSCNGHKVVICKVLKFIPVIRSVLYSVLTSNFSTFFKISRPRLEFNQYLVV